MCAGTEESSPEVNLGASNHLDQTDLAMYIFSRSAFQACFQMQTLFGTSIQSIETIVPMGIISSVY